jgi:hypothetical protein
LQPKIDAHIVSWSGQHENAVAIAERLAGHVDSLTIIHSQPGGFVPNPAWRYLLVPNDWFFGRKFAKSVEVFDGDVLMQVMADVQCDDWGRLVARCRQAFSLRPDLGAWGPDIEGTYWNLSRTLVSPIHVHTPEAVLMDSLNCVTAVDALVWAISRDVAQRMARLGYESNNLGWGVCEVACAYCHVNNRLVVLDASPKVFHAMGSGYDWGEAGIQRDGFFETASIQEQMQIKLTRLAIEYYRSRETS